MMSWLGNRRSFLAVDTETTGLNRGKDYIRLIQFGDGTAGWALDYSRWKGVAEEILLKYREPIVAHNLLYDSSMLKKDGLVIPQKLAHDSMIMAFLKNPAARMGLKGAAQLYVDKRAAVGQGALEQFMGGGGYTWATVPIDAPAYWMYGCLDTCLTALLAEKLYDEIMMNYRDAYELELAVIHCLREAELTGLLTDPDYIARASAALRAELAMLRPQIPCDPESDKQIVNFLQGIGVPLTVRTEKGNLSVDKEVMRYFEPKFPVCGLIESYRSKSRMLGSYLMKFNDLAVDHVLRASTKPVGARTGRQSVTDPPLQTLPRGRLVRDAIVSRPGTHFILADFKAQEMRVMASDAKETAMLAAFNRGEDLHNFVATALYGASFTKQQRSICKNAGFSKIYGAGIEKFALTAKIPVHEAQQFLAKYDEMFPGVARHMENMVNLVMQRAGGKRSGYGYVRLIDGRRLPVEGAKAYKAVNYRIQGSCAVSTKQKIVELDAAGIGNFFRLGVHDELMYEVPTEDIPEVKQIIADVMPDRGNFPGVTIEIDQDEVDRWGQHYRHDGYPKYVESYDPEWLEEAV